jgi:hypothetical protein
MNIWEAPIIIVGIIFFTVAWVIRILADTKTRNRLIDKGLVNPQVKHLFNQHEDLRTLSSLKWGMVLVAIGAAALISQLFPDYTDGEITIGLMFLFAGLAFLIYYPIAEKRMKKLQADKDQQQESGL